MEVRSKVADFRPVMATAMRGTRRGGPRSGDEAVIGKGGAQSAGFTPKPKVSFIVNALCGYCASAGRTFPVAQ